MSMDVTLWGALIAGLLSFASPCVLPLVPPYLCFLAGTSVQELTGEGEDSERGGGGRAVTGRVMAAALAFVLGFSVVFIALGATASVVGQAVTDYLGLLTYVAGAVIVVMGLHFLGVFRIPLLYREARVHVAEKPAGLLGAFVIGLAFAFGWTPCVGPVLAAILFVAGSEDSVGEGVSLLAAYSAGIGVPFLLAALFTGRFMRLLARFRGAMRRVEQVMGGLLVLTGLLFLSGEMPTIAYWLLEAFPALGGIG